MDWINTPKVAIGISLGGSVTMSIGFVLVKYCTDLKFKRIDKKRPAERFNSVVDDATLINQSARNNQLQASEATTHSMQ